MSIQGRLRAVVVAALLAPAVLAAQEPATIVGRVTNVAGVPEPAAIVSVASLNASTATGADGTYRLVVPGPRVRPGQSATLTVSRVGLVSQSRTVALQPGATLTQNFQLSADVLRLEGVVAVGQGTTLERRALGTSLGTVTGDELRASNETNLVAGLAGRVPNVWVTKSSGDPGSGAYLLVRGAKTITGPTQPLFVVDGLPIDNKSLLIEDQIAGTVVANRASDLNAHDIESVEILKGAAASAIYGSRAAQGVVLITTRQGRRNSSRMTFRSSYSADEVNGRIPLQRSYGRGVANPGNVTDDLDPANIRTWGVQLGESTPTYDHWGMLFRQGRLLENNAALSGGGDRTTYYLSAGWVDQEGVLRGNSRYDRLSLRAKAEHQLGDNLRVGGNLNYLRVGSDLLQKGNTTSGVLLSALRQPPEFNPCRSPAQGGAPGRCWLNAAGLHYSYRNPTPGAPEDFRGFDNPFWVLNEITNTSDVDRYIGSAHVDWQALPWLNVNWVVGADRSVDERHSLFPTGSSDFPDGRLIRAELTSDQWDHTLLATARWSRGPRLSGTVTVGQNLSQAELGVDQVNGYGLLAGTDSTVAQLPTTYDSRIRSDGYFVQGTVDVDDRLFLTAALRADGGSTFGGDTHRFFYPKISAAYDFGRLPAFQRWLDQGKVRMAFGVAGVQPPVFANTSGFLTGMVFDAWLAPNGLSTIYQGQEGVYSQAIQGNADIAPERTREFEAGVDVAVLDGRVALGVTYYDARTDGAVIPITLPNSTGYTAQYRNAADISNRGWELTLDVVPVQRENVRWTVGAQWARNEGCVRELENAAYYSLSGFPGSYSAVVAPVKDPAGNLLGCHDYGVLYGQDFVRFGRGILVQGQNIDALYPNAAPGDLYLNSFGLPVMDTQNRVIGDPNPDWTASVRTAVTLWDRLQISGLVDVKYGGDMWNGTRGALYSYGTHKDTEAWHGSGLPVVFGSTFMSGTGAAGPGCPNGQCVPTLLNWATWGFLGPGNSFTGPGSQFVEDAGFVKLRDITAAYTLDRPFLRRWGFESLELSVSGRNLKTWTGYSGIDPESNLTNQSAGRGIDFFNHPQTRSWVLSATLSR